MSLPGGTFRPVIWFNQARPTFCFMEDSFHLTENWQHVPIVSAPGEEPRRYAPLPRGVETRTVFGPDEHEFETPLMARIPHQIQVRASVQTQNGVSLLGSSTGQLIPVFMRADLSQTIGSVLAELEASKSPAEWICIFGRKLAPGSFQLSINSEIVNPEVTVGKANLFEVNASSHGIVISVADLTLLSAAKRSLKSTSEMTNLDYAKLVAQKESSRGNPSIFLSPLGDAARRFCGADAAKTELYKVKEDERTQQLAEQQPLAYAA
jgi:hypothetical protein